MYDSDDRSDLEYELDFIFGADDWRDSPESRMIGLDNITGSFIIYKIIYCLLCVASLVFLFANAISPLAYKIGFFQNENPILASLSTLLKGKLTTEALKWAAILVIMVLVTIVMFLHAAFSSKKDVCLRPASKIATFLAVAYIVIPIVTKIAATDISIIYYINLGMVVVLAMMGFGLQDRNVLIKFFHKGFCLLPATIVVFNIFEPWSATFSLFKSGTSWLTLVKNFFSSGANHTPLVFVLALVLLTLLTILAHVFSRYPRDIEKRQYLATSAVLSAITCLVLVATFSALSNGTNTESVRPVSFIVMTVSSVIATILGIVRSSTAYE